MIFLYMQMQDTWSAMENTIGKIKEHNIKIIDKRSVTEIKDMNINLLIFLMML